MATRKTSPVKSKQAPAAAIPDKSINEFTRNAMMVYGTEVNEGRSVPALQDGLKPVARRVLWAAHSVAKTKVKSARLVGDVIGKYHPHGDASVASALTTLVNHPMPVLTGIGNWGSLIDGAAAVRYTNLHLSKYGEQFLRPAYLAVTPMVPNYDDRDVEPAYLPSLLPNILINDSLGIGVGVATSLPAFTPTSVLNMLLRILDREELTALDYVKGLEFFEPWGGTPVKSAANRAAIKAFFESTSGTVEFDSPVNEDRDAKRMMVNRFAPGLNVEKFVAACRLLPNVDSVYSGKGLSFIIQVKRSANFNEYDKVVQSVKRLARTKKKYAIYVSDRIAYTDEKTGATAYRVEFHSLSIPDLLRKWLGFRVRLERDSLTWLLGERNKDKAYVELLLHACDHLDVIFAALRKDDPAKHIAKGLNITLDEAKQILELKVRQLSKLDQDQLKAKLADLKATIKSLEAKLRKPADSVRAYFEACLPKLTMSQRQPNSGCDQWWLGTPSTST